MTLLQKLLGDTLVSRRGQVPTDQALADKPVVGLYFTASSCRPCQEFTPILATMYRNMTLPMYKQLTMQDKLEVVLVSMDRDASAFRDYLLQMPFLALPYQRREVARDLWKRYEVKTIPTLIFVNEHGEEIEREGRRFVENHFTDLRKIWEHLRQQHKTANMDAEPMP